MVVYILAQDAKERQQWVNVLRLVSQLTDENLKQNNSSGTLQHTFKSDNNGNSDLTYDLDFPFQTKIQYSPLSVFK